MAGTGHLGGLKGELSSELQGRSNQAPDGILIPPAALIQRRVMSLTGDVGIHDGAAVGTESTSFLAALPMQTPSVPSRASCFPASGQ